MRSEYRHGILKFGVAAAMIEGCHGLPLPDQGRGSQRLGVECPVAASYRNIPFADLYVDSVHSISDSPEPGPELSDDDRISAAVLVRTADL